MFLWSMLNNINLDTGSHLMRYLANVSKASTRNIVIDELITLIALTLAYDLTDLQEATDSTRIDIEACITITSESLS